MVAMTAVASRRSQVMAAVTGSAWGAALARPVTARRNPAQRSTLSLARSTGRSAAAGTGSMSWRMSRILRASATA
jgi:hypothetical protein